VEPIPHTRPVHLKQDDDYRLFRKYADTKFRWPDGGACLDCPLYRITVTATGRFDHFESDTVAVRANPATKAFHYSGASEAPLSRFVLQSVSDVATMQIDPSLYAESKRRDLSLEEANDLVTTFLTGRGSTKRAAFGLEKYSNEHYPEFQFFQAIFDKNGSFNLGHYAVDRKTGDVWNGVVCEQFTSASLLRLERAIRNRIGLTEEQYRKVQRPGPMCDPGEKPEVVRGR